MTPLDGLRGLAALAVVVYHCHPLLAGTFAEKVVIWWWSGVTMFFVLSAFLITGIILDTAPQAEFYRSFFARRALRIWPAYWLLLFLQYFFFPFVFSGWRWMLQEVVRAPWIFLLLFIQNLPHLAVPGAILPTWSVAVEQQFYLLWTPIARSLKPRSLFTAALLMLLASPLLRRYAGHGLAPTHTLLHLDGLAIGCLLAIALRMTDWSLACWRWIARTAILIGLFGVWVMLRCGTAWNDTLLAIGFAGLLLAAVAGQGSEKPSLLARGLSLAPLRFLGTISYGLYLVHVMVYSLMGGIVDAHLHAYGLPGNLAIVAIRLTVAILAATLMWYKFEKPLLGFKRYFKFTASTQVARNL